MATLSTPVGHSRAVVGVCMIAAPAALLLGELLHPDARPDAADQLQVLSTSTTRQYAAHVTFLAALVLFVPALHGLARLLADKRAAWGRVGLGLGIVGTVGLAAFAGAELVTWQIGKAAGSDSAAMTALLQRLNTSAGFAPLLIVAFAFPVGYAVLAAGLYLARAVAPWQAVLLGAGPLATLIAEFAYAPKLAIVLPAIAFLIGSGSVGLSDIASARTERRRRVTAMGRP